MTLLPAQTMDWAVRALLLQRQEMTAQEMLLRRGQNAVARSFQFQIMLPRET